MRCSFRHRFQAGSLIIEAKIQLAVVVRDANLKLVQPAGSAEHVSRERRIVGEIDRLKDLESEHSHAELVPINAEAIPGDGDDAERVPTLDLEAEPLTVLPLEDTKRSPSI